MKIAKKRIGTSRNEFSRVQTSSVKAGKTRSDPNFRNTDISETRETKRFRKTSLSQGLSIGGRDDIKSVARVIFLLFL